MSLKVMHIKVPGWSQIYRTMDTEIFCHLEPCLHNKSVTYKNRTYLKKCHGDFNVFRNRPDYNTTIWVFYSRLPAMHLPE